MSPAAAKVLIVDDSAVVREVLRRVLDTDRRLQVIGAVADPVFAMRHMQTVWPDVIVLDVEMPRMDGLTFLRRLMTERPTPVVICSTLTTQGAETTLQALAAGALAIVPKPAAGLRSHLEEEADSLIHTVLNAARARVRTPSPAVAPVPQRLTADAVLPPTRGPGDPAVSITTDRVVAIGTSTGGTQALEHLLAQWPPDGPGVVAVQHMPSQYTAAFAARLNSACRIEVREARHGDRVHPGLALIAPGGRHLALERSGAQYRVAVLDGPPVSRHRPSVDVLFRSVARHAGRNAVGVIMTGMGDDGARGLKEMRDTGAPTFGQDEATCVVYGMPREAMRLGAVQHELPLASLAGAVIAATEGRRTA